jgi:hypothetical protein
MSRSPPALSPPRSWFESHAATQLPAPSVATRGRASVRVAFASVLIGAGALQLAPLSVEREKRVSPRRAALN